MSIVTKIVGVVAVCIGIGIFYIDYLVFHAIGALTLWIATSIGATGAAATGIQVVGWLLTLSAMIAIAVSGCFAVVAGIGLIQE